MRHSLALSFGIAWSVLVGPSVVSGCTEISKHEDASIEFDDLWTANDLPCADRKFQVLSTVKLRDRLLDATNVSANECFEIGAVIWRATLPARMVAASALPVTFKAELTLRVASKERRLPGAVSVVSADRMIVTAGEITVNMTRGSKIGDAVRENMADANRDAAVDGKNKDSSETASAGPAADGGMNGGASGGDAPEPAAGSGAAGSGAAGTPASRGNPGMPHSAGGLGGAGSGAGGRSPTSIGGAGAAAATAGRGAMVAGNPAPSAGTGATPAAGSGGSKDTPGDGTKVWGCIDTIGGCTCSLDVPERGGDECTAKPPCCHEFMDRDVLWCQCWPALNPACYSLSLRVMEGTARSVPTCPPP